jgi:hypothetical protein
LSTLQVLIVNPLPGQSNFTSIRRAQRYAIKGRAVFVGDSAIKFIDDEHRAAWASSLVTKAGYDGVERSLTLNEVAHLPVVNAEALFAPTGSKHFRRSTDGKNGKVTWLVRNGVPVAAQYGAGR